ncbi:MAG: biotin/lipoyl-containing protein [Syntrophotaleaceae bacterium]
MKMETNVKAAKDGVVSEVLVFEGMQVEAGELLVILD